MANERQASLEINEYVKQMQPGWNLGNTFDAVGTDETAWGNPRVTKELIEQIAAQGFNSIRIPITFDQRMSGAPDYTIDPAFIQRVEQAVQWSLDEDLYVMINIHHDSWIWLEEGMYNDYDASLDRFDAIWEQLAERFKDYPVEVMFESINEPRFWGSEEEKFQFLYDLNTSFYDIVRNSGGNNGIRPLVLPTMDTGSDQRKLDELYDTIVQLDDPYIISTIHFYGFWPFSVNVAGFTRFDDATKQDIIETFDRVHARFTANGIPVVIGEFGLLGFDTHTGVIQQGEKLKFFEYMIHYAQQKEFTHMLWDNGQHFGRTSYTWSDQQLYEMMKASWETRSATAESNFIYITQGEAIADTDLLFELNGNECVALKLGNDTLIEGQDYVLHENVMTIKQAVLADIVSSGELGVQATLTAQFNHGANWYIDVILVDTPLLENTSGTTEHFAIPTQFNGDSLATMEAVYADGSYAGPHNWTAFKEFGQAFSPDYEANEIKLPQRFFHEVLDGEVFLTFHFWSGTQLSYQLTKAGNQVVGEAILDQTPPHDDKEEEQPTDDEKEQDETTPPPKQKEKKPKKEKNNEKEPKTTKKEKQLSSGAKIEGELPTSSNQGGKALPKTATVYYQLLVAGLLTLLAGGTFLFKR